MSCCGRRKNSPIPKARPKKPKVFTKSKNIVEGWYNLVTQKHANSAFVKERAQICIKCIQLNTTTNFCKICGCYIPAKITVKKEQCPFDFWLSTK